VAAPVMVFDVLKGFVPAFLFVRWDGAPDVRWALAYGAAAIVGHVFSVYMRFKGGKGVATGAGVFLALAPIAVGVGLLVWLVTLWRTRMVSLGSILAALTVAVLLLLVPRDRYAVRVLGSGSPRSSSSRTAPTSGASCAGRSPGSAVRRARWRPRRRGGRGGSAVSGLAGAARRGGRRRQLGDGARQPAGGEGDRHHPLVVRTRGCGGDQPRPRNPRYLEGIRLDPRLRATADLAEAVRGAELVLSVSAPRTRCAG
jgi:hypothetical protein